MFPFVPVSIGANKENATAIHPVLLLRSVILYPCLDLNPIPFLAP
jgi:hypothetical protein